MTSQRKTTHHSLFLTAMSGMIFAGAIANAQEAPPTPKPGPEHAILKKEVGTWKVTSKFYFQGSEGKPTVYEGMEKNELVADGLWLRIHFETDFLGKRFKGYGLTGYDPHKKKYIGSWVDNHSVSFSTLEGTYDKKANTLTMMMKGRGQNPDETMIQKHITTYIDENTKKFEIFLQIPGDDGKVNYVKLMETLSKRQKK